MNGAEDSMYLRNGGLQELFAMVLAGLAAKTPRMVSASVIALARLTFEFGPELQLTAATLLPPVCTLLHKKAREIIKAVLGFLKVAAMRVPVELLTPHLPIIIEGVLLWAEDSKNKFRFKIRKLLQYLCKRCGYEAVAGLWPESHAKLLTSIRKEFSRKARRKVAAAGAASEHGRSVDGRQTVISAARTARASEWGHSAIFSDDREGTEVLTSGAGARSLAGRTHISRRTGLTSRTGVFILQRNAIHDRYYLYWH
jgi:ribosomal RNA-processing protein 12